MISDRGRFVSSQQKCDNFANKTSAKSTTGQTGGHILCYLLVYPGYLL